MSRLTLYAGGGAGSLAPPVVAALGDSISGKYFWQLCYLSKGMLRPRPTHVLSYSGQTTQTVWSHLPDLLALTPRPQVVFVQAGTNDIAAGLSVGNYRTQMGGLINAVLAAGLTPIVLAVPPKTGSATAVAQYNAWLAPWCRNRNVLFIDVHAPLVDTTGGDWLAGYSSDGTHPTGAGLRVYVSTILTALGAALPTVMPPLVAWDGDTTNLLAHGLFLTNTSGLGTGWSLSGAGSCVASITAAGAGDIGNWQTVTGGTTNTGLNYLIQSVSPASHYTDGDRLFCGCRFKMSGFEGTSGSVLAQVNIVGGSGHVGAGNWIQAGTANVTDSFLVFDITLGTGATSIQFLIQHSGQPTPAAFSVAQATLVNLSTQGVTI